MVASQARARLRIALVFGGRSAEHEVSVVSARSVDRALDRERYEVVPMAIDRLGRWADAETSERVLAGSADRADGVLAFAGRDRLDPRLLHEPFDAAFPVLHGPFGEDGTIQGLFEMLGLPFVGCDTAASAVCMDKIFCKRMLAHAGLATPAWEELDRGSWQEDRAGVSGRCMALGLPLFVKPARLGSSVGITKVARRDDLEAAVDEALRHGERALVERGLDAREIEVAVIGNRRPLASVPGEVVPGHEFYDYADKYLDSACQLLAPAPLDEATASNAQQLALEAFRLLGCEGMGRVDLFLGRADGRLWVNEVNAIPGFTSISMYPRLWGLSGLDYPALIDELVRLALERAQRAAAPS
jgi:D-alanine-D-alanine ligase